MVQKQQTAMPVVAGILIFITAGFWCLGFIALFFASLFAAAFVVPLIIVPVLLIPLVAVAFLTLFGGINSIQKKNWGLALAASIMATLPFNILGLIAVILIVMSRNEFS